MNEPIRKTYIGNFFIEEYIFSELTYVYCNGRRIYESYETALEKLKNNEELSFVVI